MLKLSKNQVKKGQQVVLNLDADLTKLKDWDDLSMATRDALKGGFKTGDIVTLQKLTGGTIYFTDSNNKEYHYFWSWFKLVSSLVGENLGAENLEYVIYLNGKKFKQKKYSDMGKIKAALLIMMDYHNIFYKKCQQHIDICPEHEYLMTPEWLNGETLSREEFSKLEIFEWQNRKLGNKVDFDPVKFYDEQMFLINFSSKYGSCVRELFKKIQPEHKFIFVYVHEDYKKPNMYYYDELKESEIIKSVLKQLKLKDTVKATKMGKTAIAVTSAIDAASILHSLPEDSKFFTVDINGNELELLDNWFVLAESRNEKIAQILADD